MCMVWSQKNVCEASLIQVELRKHTSGNAFNDFKHMVLFLSRLDYHSQQLQSHRDPKLSKANESASPKLLPTRGVEKLGMPFTLRRTSCRILGSIPQWTTERACSNIMWHLFTARPHWSSLAILRTSSSPSSLSLRGDLRESWALTSQWVNLNVSFMSTQCLNCQDAFHDMPLG